MEDYSNGITPPSQLPPPESSSQQHHHQHRQPSNSYCSKIHISNIQLLAAIDCALAVTSLAFDCRQVIEIITNHYSSSSTTTAAESAVTTALEEQDSKAAFELELEAAIAAATTTTTTNSHEERTILHTKLVIAAVASVCLTLAQLLLACLVMISLSTNRNEVLLSKPTRIISLLWTTWSTVLAVVLIMYVISIQSMENMEANLYLFMLISEIFLRIFIILYVPFVFLCFAKS